MPRRNRRPQQQHPALNLAGIWSKIRKGQANEQATDQGNEQPEARTDGRPAYGHGKRGTFSA